jgi:sugar phosphate isomerase/epimerase
MLEKQVLDNRLKLLTYFFINIPYDLLIGSYFSFFIKYRLNPEIYFSPETLDNWPETEFKTLVKELKTYNLSVTFHAPFYDLSLGSIEPKVKQITEQRLKQVLNLVPIFHPLSIVIHLGYDPRVYENCLEKWLKNSLETIEKFMPLVEKNKVYLNLENVFEPEAKVFLWIIERMSSPYINICFDIGHINAFTNTSLSDWEVIFPYIRQIHLHDNHGDKDEHLGLGKGDTDFMALFSLLKQYNCFPLITLEPHTEEAFWDSLNYLQGLTQEIKPFLKRPSLAVK